MLKKSIIGLLLLAIAMPAFAGGDVEKKILKGDWPVVYKWIEVCDGIKVYMNVGYYVKIEQCKEKKIKLAQKSIHEYEGCVNFKIKSNFDLELGARMHPNADGLKIASLGNWSAWIDGDNFLSPSTSYKTRRVCVKVKKANIGGTDPAKEVHVGNVHILVVPTATP